MFSKQAFMHACETLTVSINLLSNTLTLYLFNRWTSGHELNNGQ